MLAITGGTGAYQEARGQMRLHATGHPRGSEDDFILMLVDERWQLILEIMPGVAW